MTSGEKEELQNLADKLGLKMSDIVRLAIEFFRRHHRLAEGIEDYRP